MKTKIKKMAYGMTSIGLMAPALVMAQYVPPANTNLSNTSIAAIISNVMMWLLAIIGVIAVIGFVIAGILYLTAAGNEDQIQKAKTAMVYSIIGVIVALLGLVILTAVEAMLVGTSNAF